MPDFIKPNPYEMLYGMKADSAEKGKPYNENEMRAYVNSEYQANGWTHADYPLAAVENPEIFAENPARADAIRRDDREAKAEIDQMARQALEASEARQNAEMKREGEILALQRERDELLARLTNLELRQNGGVPTVASVAAKPSAAGDPEKGTAAVKMEGRPAGTWTMLQLTEFAAQEGLTIASEGNKPLQMLGRQRIADQLNALLDIRERGGQ